MTSGRVVGVEALARFRTQRADSPHQWFTKAWDLGLGLDLEIAAARAALSKLYRLPPEYYMAVNFSVRAILTPEFQDLIRPKATRVVVELTEHAQVQDYVALEAALEPLRRAGLRISVDDVGAGFSSFEHILRLKPDIVKLDSFLTRGVHQDAARASLTKGSSRLRALSTRRSSPKGSRAQPRSRHCSDSGSRLDRGTIWVCRRRSVTPARPRTFRSIKASVRGGLREIRCGWPGLERHCD
jgi:predicted signal transduction protein with EAL and GGDEF domain